MNAEDLFMAIGTFNSDFLEHSERTMPTKKKAIFIKWGALAACLLLIMLSSYTISHLSFTPSEPRDHKPQKSWTIVYNQISFMADASNKYAPGTFTEELNEETLSALGPVTDSKEIDYSGCAMFDGSGNLIHVIINVNNTEWNGITTVIMQKNKVVTDYILSNEPITSYFDGTEVTAWEYDDGGQILLESSFSVDDTGFLITTHSSPDNMEKAKSSMYDLIACYITGKEIDLSSVKASAIPEWMSKDMTFNEALMDAEFGSYMPSSIPQGFTFENIHRYKDQNSNFLSGLWTHGYDELRWMISYLGDEDNKRITSVKDKNNYDLSLYAIPLSDSVPAELVDIVDNPIFNVDEVTLEAIKSRAYSLADSGDNSGYRMHFSVLYGDIVIDVSSKGISPEWIYSQLKSIEH